jgi:hypothetical protein
MQGIRNVFDNTVERQTSEGDAGGLGEREPGSVGKAHELFCGVVCASVNGWKADLRLASSSAGASLDTAGRTPSMPRPTSSRRWAAFSSPRMASCAIRLASDAASPGAMVVRVEEGLISDGRILCSAPRSFDG